MADLIDEKAGATPEEPPAEPRPDDTPATAAPGAEAAAAEPRPDDAPTAAYAAPPAATGPAGTPPRQSWYRRRWAIITGAVAAGVVLFLGGMAIGTTIDGDNDFAKRAGPGMFGPGNGPGWGQQGPGWDQQGHGWDHGGEGLPDRGDGERGFSDPSGPQAPGVTPSPSSSASPGAEQGL